jgi:hypothetical protein
VNADREELERLVREIPDDQVPMEDRPWPPAFFGIAPGDGTPVGARADKLLAEGFGQQQPVSAG